MKKAICIGALFLKNATTLKVNNYGNARGSKDRLKHQRASNCTWPKNIWYGELHTIFKIELRQHGRDIDRRVKICVLKVCLNIFLFGITYKMCDSSILPIQNDGTVQYAKCTCEYYWETLWITFSWYHICYRVYRPLAHDVRPLVHDLGDWRTSKPC